MIVTKRYLSVFDQSSILLLNNSQLIRTMNVNSVNMSMSWSVIFFGHLKITTDKK